MKNSCKLWEVTKALAMTAQGLEPADLIVKNGRLINVFTGEVINGTDIAVRCGRIALVGDATHTQGKNTTVIDADGMYLSPGFIDGHLHVESSMTTVCNYASVTVPHGTTSIFMDPHEIVNVLGLPGMKAMMEDGEASPLRVYTTTPSCVPASPGLENTGSRITPDDITETMSWEGVAALGEMMNYAGILSGDDTTHEIVARALKAGKPVTGHWPLDDTAAGLNAYIASGITSCHESTTPEQALAKMRLGMYAMIREGSAWHDLRAVIKALTENEIDTALAVLVSDDLHADTLLEFGHMDHIIRLAISAGVSPVKAIQMATVNTARYFKLDGDIGSLAPGRYADINILSSLEDVRVETVMIGGKTVASSGKLVSKTDHYFYPDVFRHTVKLSHKIDPSCFALKAPNGADSAQVKVIGVHNASVITTQTVQALPVHNGCILSAPERDIIKVAVINRHNPQGGMSVGFVSGFKLTHGATASTYAHDAHNLMIIGTNDEDMAFAANTLIDCEGGMTAVCNGSVLALLALPIAGLMSDLTAPVVAQKLKELEDAWKQLGSPLVSPFMTMSLLSLAVIPEIRITDKGLVDVLKNKLTTLEA
jgi:adenine deaminase